MTDKDGPILIVEDDREQMDLLVTFVLNETRKIMDDRRGQLRRQPKRANPFATSCWEGGTHPHRMVLVHVAVKSL